MSTRGYCGIGIANGKTPANLGSLWRSARLLGASFVFTAGCRYSRQPSDTMDSARHLPLWSFLSVSDLVAAVPTGCALVAIEMRPKARALASFVHPERALYVLGAEDFGVPGVVLDRADHIVCLPGEFSMNVACAGTVVLYDRLAKQGA